MQNTKECRLHYKWHVVKTSIQYLVIDNSLWIIKDKVPIIAVYETDQSHQNHQQAWRKWSQFWQGDVVVPVGFRLHHGSWGCWSCCLAIYLQERMEREGCQAGWDMELQEFSFTVLWDELKVSQHTSTSQRCKQLQHSSKWLATTVCHPTKIPVNKTEHQKSFHKSCIQVRGWKNVSKLLKAWTNATILQNKKSPVSWS